MRDDDSRKVRALAKGLAGVVVHGCIRDTDVLEQLRFPVWATAISAMRPAKTVRDSSLQAGLFPVIDAIPRQSLAFAPFKSLKFPINEG